MHQVGDLVLIPEDVSLFKEHQKCISNLSKTKKPEYALILKKKDVFGRYLVFFNGEFWLVLNDGIFAVNE